MCKLSTICVCIHTSSMIYTTFKTCINLFLLTPFNVRLIMALFSFAVHSCVNFLLFWKDENVETKKKIKSKTGRDTLQASVSCRNASMFAPRYHGNSTPLGGRRVNEWAGRERARREGKREFGCRWGGEDVKRWDGRRERGRELYMKVGRGESKSRRKWIRAQTKGWGERVGQRPEGRR